MNVQWWQKEVIYQIYPRSFKDTNNDGVGDINGIIEKLPYLNSLGITMIWICPIFKSPMVDNGYDISDYKDINSEFGSLNDLETLLNKAKQYDIKIMLDLVVNHTSDEHEWFEAALNDPASPYRDYYIFKEGVNGAPPNNWRSIFGGSVWEKVVGEDMYYMHVFDKKQPDLNFENPKLREEIYHMINWWLRKGLAGFRIDSITFLKKDQDFESLTADGNDGLVTCKHKTRNRPGIELFLKELKQQTFEKFDCITVGEAPGVNYDELTDFIGEDGYFSMIFDFKYTDIDVESGSDWFKRTNWTTEEYKKLLFESQEAIQKVGWGANFIENHDQPRALSKLVKDPSYQNFVGGSAIAMLYFFLRGTPFIYQGQELGMTNFERQSIDQFNDISSIDNFHRSIEEGFTEEQAMEFVNLRSRDNTRTPLPWNDQKFGGFSKTKPWIDLIENYKTINVQIEENTSSSLLNFYRELIQLRNHSKYSQTLIYGNFTAHRETNENIISYFRNDQTTKLQIIVNLSNKHNDIDIKNTNYELILDNYGAVEKTENKIKLRPYEALIIEIKI
ncbi:alpha-glucosidase [Staphylococcus durrellii]|uniref:alpha-glucosidase n=1 Tax=Staphylococcus durrellii TaxID=2781773 RepID=UPI00189DD42F|nr:alpha-glucosidase [Staphylococcus durrellii]MBF7018134.1 alpha-glucosidase [Staphylococcus durrellii]